MLNAMRTTILLAALTALFMLVGYLVGGTGGMVLAFGFALATNLFAYWNADKLVLRMQNAQEIDRHSMPDLYQMVERLARNAGLPMPRLYLIQSDQPNAFATGRNPQHAAVAVSSGLLHMLEPREVAGVVAHELGHIRSRDTLTMTITATLAGAVSMLAQFGFFFGGRNSNSPMGPFGAIAAMLLAPMAAMMVQMAVSRAREYEADRDGAEISGDPLALASALGKISGIARQVPNESARRMPGMAHMFIINPLAGGRMDNLFATHPDVHNRVTALEKLSQQMRPVQADFNAPPLSSRAKRTAGRSARGGSGGWRVPSAGPHKQKKHSDGPARGPWG